MVYDVNSVASTMDRKIKQMDYTANNLANASTPGFKAEHLHALQATGAEEVSPTEPTVDFRPGLAEKTGNALDVLIEGDGFFVIQVKGGLAFTRRGDFTIDRDNRLVTQDGAPVMGESGFITLNKGNIHIGRDGSVSLDSSVVGNLRIVEFNSRTELTPIGGGLYRDSGAAGMKKSQDLQIASGFLELSNVNMIREMTEMIEINRSFENYQKIIQTLSELDRLSVSRIGRLA
ncbi:MAG: flagellar hook basal-body protein [Pseudomonadota bacterium]